MNEENARDPYLGLSNLMRRQAKSQIPSYYSIGEVISVEPMIIRADGLNLDKHDFMIAQHLKPGFTEHLTNLAWTITATLPLKRLTGTCTCSFGTGEAEVLRPSETISGKTTEQANITHDQPLAVGDMVLLIPSSDGQIYYIADKFVEVDA